MKSFRYYVLKYASKSNSKEIEQIEDLDELEMVEDPTEEKDEDDVVLVPAPFYTSQYGYSGFEGMFSSPVEYYSGSIADQGNEVLNPYNGTYSLAERIAIFKKIAKNK